jgi:hypothetical protein
MFITALFTIAKIWKQPRCPTTEEWIKKMWYLYTIEFYAAMKKSEILSFASKWMELENIIVSEFSLAQKTKNRMFSLICGHEINGKHNEGIGLSSSDKARAHKGGMRIRKTPQKLDSICCPQRRETKADTLKQMRSIGEGDQELERKLVQEEIT